MSFADTTFPFRLRSAQKLFTAVADVIKWIVRCEGVDDNL